MDSAMTDPVCRVCNEPKSAHIATSKGPYTHPREARGEGTYRLKSAGTIGGGVERDDLPFEVWEFVPTQVSGISDGSGEQK